MLFPNHDLDTLERNNMASHRFLLL